MLLLIIIIVLIFVIYMFFNEGYIYIASKHFEKELSTKKIKERFNNTSQEKCKICGGPLDNNLNICSKCINKEVTNYSNTNEFKNTKKTNTKRNF